MEDLACLHKCMNMKVHVPPEVYESASMIFSLTYEYANILVFIASTLAFIHVNMCKYFAVVVMNVFSYRNI